MDYAYRHILIIHNGDSPPLWALHSKDQLEIEGGYIVTMTPFLNLETQLRQAHKGEYDGFIMIDEDLKLMTTQLDDFDGIRLIICDDELTFQDKHNYFGLERPFHISSLISLLGQAIAIRDQGLTKIYDFGPWEIDFEKKSLSLTKPQKGKSQPLTDKEIMILFHLMRANRQVVTKDHLLISLWGYQKGTETHTIETHIYKLRQKFNQLQNDNQNFTIPLITKGDGYILYQTKEGDDLE